MLISKTVIKTNTTFHIAFMIACLLINNDMSMPFENYDISMKLPTKKKSSLHFKNSMHFAIYHIKHVA